MAIQPTERGKKIKRAQGYYLNDISILVLDAVSGELITFSLGGAKRDTCCRMFLEADREYLVAPISFRAQQGPFVLRIFAAHPVLVQTRASVPKEWTLAAIHSLVLRPNFPPRVQRLVYNLGIGNGCLIIVEGPAMAIGVAINLHATANLRLLLSTAGNHSIVRGCAGLLEGIISKDRNDSAAKLPTKSNGRGSSKAPKADWREYLLETVIKASCQQLVFVAVALIEQHWEFNLEGVFAEQSLDYQVSTESKHDTFAPIRAEANVLNSIPVSQLMGCPFGIEEINDPLEPNSLFDVQGGNSSNTAAQMEVLNEIEAAELELALQISVAELGCQEPAQKDFASPSVPEDQSDVRSSGSRWSRRTLQRNQQPQDSC